MKTKFAFITFALSVFAGTQANAGQFYDYAKVTRVTPVYDYVQIREPVQTCYPVRTRRHRSGASTVTGAIVGGAIGNAIGENSASTLAGVIIGTAVGASAEPRYTRVRQHCETRYERVREQKQLTGYKVRYRYKGEKYRTFMDHHPGDKIKVRVKVSPAY